MWTTALLAVPVVAALELRAERRLLRRPIYVFKPPTTALLALVAVLAPQPVSPVYQGAVVLGLLCSLAGDVFLVLPRRFLPGLVCFLAAHTCYIVAFAQAAGLPESPLALAAFAAYGAALLYRLWPQLGRYRLPVVGYCAVLLLMAATAHEQLLHGAGLRPWLAFAGAVLFVLSDSALALDRFEDGGRRRQTLVLGSYFAGQLLIAATVHQVGG
jgi:uncharacterized membrane protein YhhN